MLTSLDDTLWHQLPTKFDHVGTSDPRFFDRYWFALYAPDGSAAAQVTMHVETDVWNVSAPAQIVYPNGSTNEHWHRIQPVAVHARLGASAESHGTGSMTLILSGKIPHFGLE